MGTFHLRNRCFTTPPSPIFVRLISSIAFLVTIHPPIEIGSANTARQTGTKYVIEWKVPADLKNQDQLEPWRRGVGPPLVEIPFGPAIGNKILDCLIVVSWNIKVGGGDLDGFIHDLRSGKLTEGQPTHDFVLLLQEVFRKGSAVPANGPLKVQSGRYIAPKPRSAGRIDILEAARRQKLALYYVPAMRNGKPADHRPPEDRGNAIISTLPLTAFSALELPYERQRRIAMGAKIAAQTTAGTPWTIQLVNVHLENRARWSEFCRSFGKARLRQTKAVLEAYLTATATILGGDFNTWYGGRNEPAIEYVQRYFNPPSASKLPGTIQPGHGLSDRMLDYLFFRLPDSWSATYRRIDNRYGSDHYPLLGHVLIRK